MPESEQSAGTRRPQPGLDPIAMGRHLHHHCERQEELRRVLTTPPQYLVGKKTDRGVTNIRNTKSPHWRRWLGPEHRCLVPFDAFAEQRQGSGNAWFRIADGRPAFFAGLHVPGWTSVRKLKDGETTDDLYGFLTTEPNAIVGSVNPKAMPVILTEPKDWEAWLSAPWTEASRMQRPLSERFLEHF